MEEFRNQWFGQGSFQGSFFFSSPGNHPSLVVVKVQRFHFACFWRNAEQVILMEEMHHITACCLPFTLAAHYLMLTKYWFFDTLADFLIKIFKNFLTFLQCSTSYVLMHIGSTKNINRRIGPVLDLVISWFLFFFLWLISLIYFLPFSFGRRLCGFFFHLFIFSSSKASPA